MTDGWRMSLICAAKSSSGSPATRFPHFVCFHLFVRRALRCLLGKPAPALTKSVLADAMPDAQNAPRNLVARSPLSSRELASNAARCPGKAPATSRACPTPTPLLHVPASTSSLDAGTMVELLVTRKHFTIMTATLELQPVFGFLHPVRGLCESAFRIPEGFQNPSRWLRPAGRHHRFWLKSVPTPAGVSRKGCSQLLPLKRFCNPCRGMGIFLYPTGGSRPQRAQPPATVL